MAEINARRYPPKATDAELSQLTLYEDAYAGYDEGNTPETSPHHPSKALTASQLAGDWKRFWRPRNFLAKVVEEPVGYLGQLEPTIALYRLGANGKREKLSEESEADKQLLAQIGDFMAKKIKPRQADVVLWQGLYGRSFGKVIYDPGVVTYEGVDGEDATIEVEPAIHIIPYPRMEGHVERAEAFFDSEDPDRVTSAAVYWIELERLGEGKTEERKYAQLLYPDRIEWLQFRSGVWQLCPEKSESGDGIDYHDWNVVPIAVCWNNGKPDVHDGIDAQIIVNKDLFDAAAAADQAAFPQRWRKGVIPQGGWKRNPLSGQQEITPPLKSGPFILWDVPLDGEVGQLDASDGGFLREKYKGDVMDLATLTNSVAVAKMYFASDTSGSSKSMDTLQQLKPRIDRKAEGLGAWATSIFKILQAMSVDKAVADALGFDLTDVEVEVHYEPAIDRDAAAEHDQDFKDVSAKKMSLYTYLRNRGMSDGEARKEMERIAEEEQAAMDQQVQVQQQLNPLAATAKGVGAAKAPAAPKAPSPPSPPKANGSG